MNKMTILWLVIATVLVLVGCILFGVAMFRLDWNFHMLSTVTYETNQYASLEPFENIVIITDTAHVKLVAADSVSLNCYEQENAKHTVSVRDGTLYIEICDKTKWYDHIGINFDYPGIHLCLPGGQYGTLQIEGNTGAVSIPSDFSFANLDIALSTGDVRCYASTTGTAKIRTSTGNIRMENVSAGALSLSASTGRVTVSDVVCAGDLQLRVSTGKASLTNVSCKNLISSGNTGDLSLDAVIAVESISIERSTGDVSFDRCDAAQLTIVTDTGDVTGTLLSPKIFLCETDTGRVELPQTTTGGTCKITTDTGDIRITIALN